MRKLIFLLFSFLFSAQSFTQDSTIIEISCGEKSDIYDLPEIDPMFPGGMDSMMTFIAKHFMIPGTCASYSVVIYVGFIVNTDGSLTNVEIIKGSDTVLDHEALRVVKLMPHWIPGQNGGKVVRSSYIIPISVRIK